MVDWNKILAAHGPTVWRTVYRLLGHHADALDCYQETFMAAYRVVGRQPIAHWPSFLTSLATRRAIDRLRHRGRSRRHVVSLSDAPEPVSQGDSPIEHTQGVERLDEVRSLLAGLPEKQAEVFWLSCVEGMQHRDIGDQLQISPGEVRVLLHRARTRLRSALEHRLPDSWRNR
ncbi:MAG: RNA polymerase sigma factor [Isosphaeraceae bacterium]